MYRDDKGAQNEEVINNLFLAANTPRVFERLSPAEQDELADFLASYTKATLRGLKVSGEIVYEAVRDFR